MKEYKLITDPSFPKEGEIRMKKYKSKGKERIEFFQRVNGKWKYYPIPEEFRKPVGGSLPVGHISEDYVDGRLVAYREKMPDGTWKRTPAPGITTSRKGINGLPDGTIRESGRRVFQKQGDEWVLIKINLRKSGNSYPEGAIRTKKSSNGRSITQQKKNGKWMTIYKDKQDYIIPENTPIGKYGPRPELRSLVYGIGENDVMIPEFTKTKIHSTWVGIVRRTDQRDLIWLENKPSYKDCTLDPRWYKLSAFKEWIEQWEDFENKECDKDILIPGNKIYGPDTCLMVRPIVNSWFMPNSGKGDLPRGVSWNSAWKNGKSPNPYAVQINLIESKKRVYLGLYSSLEEAVSVYKKARKEQIQILIDTETDLKVKQAMVNHLCHL